MKRASLAQVMSLIGILSLPALHLSPGAGQESNRAKARQY